MRLLQTRRSKAAEHCSTPKPGGNNALISRLAFWSATASRRFSMEQASLLLYRVGRHNFDTLNVHPFFGSIVGTGLGSRNLFQDIVALNQFPESCVLAIEEFWRTMADEELAAS